MKTDNTFLPLNIAILTISDSRTEADDISGTTLVDRVATANHHLSEKKIVRDDIYQIRAVISDWVATPDINAIITTKLRYVAIFHPPEENC